MSNETNPKTPPDPKTPDWPRLLLDLRVAFDDGDAVTRDLLRKKRKRDLGYREAKRLYRDSRDQILKLLALAGGGGNNGDGGDEDGRDPAGSGGSPAD
jgi:hypothetical protein